MRILEGRAAESYVRKLEQRGQRAGRTGAAGAAHCRRVCDGMATGRCGRYAERWDGLGSGDALRVSKDEMQAALKSFLAGTASCARDCGRQHPQFLRVAETSRVGARRSRAGSWANWCVRSVPSGCYVPGGRYPLPSTLLMTVIPAQVAGVKDIRVVSPRPAQATLAAAALLGVTRVLPHRGSAGDCGAGVRHKECSAGKQDRWAGKFVCDYGEETRRV